MKIKITILLLVLSCYTFISLQGQTPMIKNQRGFKYMFSVYLDTIGFIKPDKRKIDIDLRIWHDCYTTGQTKLIRLIKFKNGDWFAHSLDYYCYNDSHCELSNFKIDTLSLSNTWTSTWNIIVGENLLNLPKQEELNKKLKTADGEILVVADGSGYCFEICSRKAKRRFCYGNPNSHFEFYKEKGIVSEDYKKVLHLIELIDKEFDWTFRVNKTIE